ncbi:formate dehydrogenase subunit delta [Kribbella hippodromi]
MPPYVRLANEIAAQFAHRPAADAATAIANHLRATWDPRMKRALIEYAQSGAQDLAPAAAQATHHLQSRP